MPWEVRGQQRYFYKPVRIDGLPRRMYLGTGPAGRLHEILDRQQRRRNQSLREERLRIAEEIADENLQWRAIHSWIRALTASTYLIAGYYQHHGEWRPIMGRPHTREHASP